VQIQIPRGIIICLVILLALVLLFFARQMRNSHFYLYVAAYLGIVILSTIAILKLRRKDE